MTTDSPVFFRRNVFDLRPLGTSDQSGLRLVGLRREQRIYGRQTDLLDDRGFAVASLSTDEIIEGAALTNIQGTIFDFLLIFPHTAVQTEAK